MFLSSYGGNESYKLDDINFLTNAFVNMTSMTYLVIGFRYQTKCDYSNLPATVNNAPALKKLYLRFDYTKTWTGFPTATINLPLTHLYINTYYMNYGGYTAN
jgi:hypothetical protein